MAAIWSRSYASGDARRITSDFKDEPESAHSFRTEGLQNLPGQRLFHFQMSQNRLNDTRPQGGALRLLASNSSRSGAIASPARDASSEGDDRLNSIAGQAALGIFNSVFENQANRLLQTLLGFLDRLALPIRARNFRTNRPVATLRGFRDDYRKLPFHVRNDALLFFGGQRWARRRFFAKRQTQPFRVLLRVVHSQGISRLYRLIRW
ncbi:MAG: hypothetical protein QOH31_3742 [Verrucomicrobiota bacterium]